MKGRQRIGRWLTMTIFMIIATGLTTTSQASDWWEKVKIKGDFRYRHEIINQEMKEIRHRERIRARVNIEGKVSDEGTVVLGISSGSSDPVSNNQTLGDAFTTKDLLIDVAYFQLKPKQIEGLTFTGGKMYNPFFLPGESELIWDSDIRQEGLSLNYQREFGNLTVELVGSGFWVMERSSADDSYLAGGQAVLGYESDDEKTEFNIGGSYFSYGNVKGYPLFYEEDYSYGNSYNMTADTVSLLAPGNDTVMTITDNYTYMYDYELIELFGEISHKFNEIPVTLLGDYVTNTAVDSLKNGWLVGIRVGKTKKPGSWSFHYNYRKVEKDAVFGLFTDSDFRGGGTNAKGHEVGAGYQLMDNTALAVTYFNNKINLQPGDQIGFQRWQFDLKFKF